MATTDVLQRNIELARKAYEAFNKADIEAVMAQIADDCVWHGGPRGPFSGDYKGKAAILELFMKFGQATEGTYKAEIHDILVNDQHGVVLGTSSGTRKGKRREDKFVDVVHLDADGKVKEYWRFVEDQVGSIEFLES